jgi:hypothetical protein
MESIRTDLRGSERPPRSRDEIDLEIAGLRDEADDEVQAVERLQGELRQARGNPGKEEVV